MVRRNSITTKIYAGSSINTGAFVDSSYQGVIIVEECLMSNRPVHNECVECMASD